MYEPMTNDAKLLLGREVAEDPTCQDMERQGRPLTNVEMDAATTWLREVRRKAKQFVKDEL